MIYGMKLSEELLWRGQIKDKTFDDVSWIDTPRTFYLGTDCSSDSLQIGNLAVYMLARRLKKHGWNAVLLVGGATSLIGDPGGKESERELKSREEIKANVKAISAQVSQLFQGEDFETVDNYDWFKAIGYLEFLREVGKHYSMTELLQRDFIVSRIGEEGSGISYAEFSYSLIQGYDYWHLYKNKGVELQIGGSDQWGNMLSGVPLVRKKEGKQVHALSMPLVIDKSTGRKFGKSESGTVWLDPNKTSPYMFYQFWLNTDDAGVEDFLKIYTDLSKDEIAGVLEEFDKDKSARIAQKTLAYEVTKIVHGEKIAQSIKRISGVLFGDTPYEKLQSTDIASLAEELTITPAEDGDSYIDVVINSGLANSKSEARHLLEQKAIYINGTAINIGDKVSLTNTLDGTYAIIRRGKNNNALVQINK